MVKKARALKKEKGIFPDVSPKKAKKLSEETKRRVIDFYNDDEVSRVCPGKKDFVSVINSEGKREHVQKRLLLANLRELYLHFKEKSGDEDNGFSKFCELRPLVGALPLELKERIRYAFANSIRTSSYCWLRSLVQSSIINA